jgi:hypothetical protein
MKLPVESSDDIRMNNGRILLGEGGWSADVAERDAWNSTFLAGQPRGSDAEFRGGPVAIRGERVVPDVPGMPCTYDLEPQQIAYQP